jgi:uncharacterized protein
MIRRKSFLNLPIMIAPNHRFKKYFCAALCLNLMLVANSCRKEKAAPVKKALPSVIRVTKLDQNRLYGSGTAILDSQALSSVHWQPWSHVTLDLAKQANRPLFALITYSAFPGSIDLLNQIEKSPDLIKQINEQFVPVLVDGGSQREAAIIAAILSQEGQASVSFPFLLFLSPDGNEVSWKPLPYNPGASNEQLLRDVISLVSSTWKESPDYVTKNSKEDHDRRAALTLIEAEPANTSISLRDTTLNEATRSLLGLYDDSAQNFYNIGGLLPTGLINLLDSSSRDPFLPEPIRKQARKITQEFGLTLLKSAMVDPLDGGVYHSRISSSWDVPSPGRIASGQARAISAWVNLYHSTGDSHFLDAAKAAMAYTEANFQSSNGLFSMDMEPAEIQPLDLMWSLDEVKSLLSPEEAGLWIKVCQIEALGNIPSEVDTNKTFFRKNKLARHIELKDAATELGMTQEKAAQAWESGRRKLLEAREKRFKQTPARECASTPASLYMISAYASLYTATGDEMWRNKAVQLAKNVRSTLMDGSLMLEFLSPSQPDIAKGRAFTYALAALAYLDLSEITLDPSWNQQASQVIDTLAERFVRDGKLFENEADSYACTMAITDRGMVFGDSTAGLTRQALRRLSARNITVPPALQPWLSSLPDYKNYPVIFTDSFLAISQERTHVSLEIPANASPEWLKEATTLPLASFVRKIGIGSACQVKDAKGQTLTLGSPEELKQWTRQQLSGIGQN